MAEAGGPTTQSGIPYQNSIAALYLGRMIDPAPRSKRDRVVGAGQHPQLWQVRSPFLLGRQQPTAG